MEWHTTTMNGIPINNGPRVHVYDLWVHERFNGSDIIHRFINKVKNQVPQAKKLTWERHTDDKQREFTRGRGHQWETLLK